MRRIVLFVSVVSILLFSGAVFAQDQTTSSQSATGRRFDNLSPEEQAKLKEKWQNASPEEKAKVRDKARERTAGTERGAPGQSRKDAGVTEVTRLQEQHKANMAELQAIKQLAVKENAKETADALTKLIARHEAQYNQQMQVLQRRMKLLQGDQGSKEGTAGQTQTEKSRKPEPRKTEPKKDESKSQNTTTKQ